jgi:hypothetical protein
MSNLEDGIQCECVENVGWRRINESGERWEGRV